ncbi:hypothetical protein OHS33_39420 (plasmid) [Streptomyces sp. NBC_00536]|uniref:hypothetical protein n=1 Tax=Streptomyces sp. NBC_00536 TaxID=2975769 RepID=UPI002E800785|nr:hypothetical protein [Streptomyces sp. NBC_00536]WUC84526.1 hypothetical protein OHS33_39420 [Streptomyces sp. NBC_00536]
MSRTRGTWNTKGTWAAGVLLAVVILLTGYAALVGDGDEAQTPAKGGGASPSVSGAASPEATYAPPQDWTEPQRWTALPRGQRTDDRGSQVGFPHTAEGAVAMTAAGNTTRVEGDHSTVDEQVRIYNSYLGKGDQSAQAAEQIKLNAQASDKTLAQEAGVPAGQPLPSGAYVRTHVVGYKVIKKSADEVTVWLLARVVQKAGETAEEKGSYTRTLAGAQWQDGDWKLTAAATIRAQQDTVGQSEPAMVAPGDDAFNDAGWTAIREAS